MPEEVSAENPAPKRANIGRPFTGKDDPRNGPGLPKGHPRAGRPADIFRLRMQSLADRAAQALEVGKILDNDEHKNYLEAAKWCAERGYGRATHVETRVNLTPDDLRALTDEQLQRLTDGEDSVVVLANQGSGGVGAEAPAGAGELDRESDEDGA